MIKDIDIVIINFKVRFALISKKQYVTQRTRDAYVVSICQFETSFDLSLVAQSIEILLKNITTLNKCLQWQINNHSRDINYVKLDSTKFRLMIFTNSFFANNRDLFSQIDYVICLTNSKHINIVHWFSIKRKCVTRSVLAIELYALTHNFDLDVVSKQRCLRFSIASYFWYYALTRNRCTIIW